MSQGFIAKLLRNRDFYAGGLMVLIGLFAASVSPGYGLGTLMRVGSGFFPMMLGAALAIVGVLIIAAGAFPKTRSEEEEEDILSALPETMDWRGWGCVLGGPIMFVILGNHFGLIPAAFGCVVVSALGDRRSTLKEALILGICVSLLGGFLFTYLMQMSFPLLTWCPSSC
jgi:putative tricarboxylic transport membrane protein